ncbi:MAG TPA: primosomal protein N' [Bacteroidetes bacterium]|nr:primosomal protein N' [Bacteroidota bacterium]
MSESQFVEVILPLALPKLYTYSVPSSLQKQLCVGARVVVQFGKKKLYSAIVYSIHSNAPSAYKTKDIVQLIDDEPLVSAVQLKFWEWMASYYMCTLGEVMKAALPSGLKMESETQLLQGAEYAVIELFNESEREVMAAVETSSSPLSIQQLISKVQVNNPIGVIKGLLDRQALAIHENIQSAFKPKYETFVRLHSRLKTDDDVNQLFEELSRADAQQKWLMAFLALTATEKKTFTDWVPKKLLAEKSNASPAAFNALIKKEIFEVESREVSRLLNKDSNEEVTLTLSDAQLEAVNKLHDDFREKNVVLLHGVTSSGKTEIYISLIQEQFAQGKQVLYLLPEIALTAQIINRLKRFFGKRVGIYHSKFSDNQRVEVYKSLLSEGIGNSGPKYDIILGVRSSIFLPFKRLGLIIVDEEHENTFKQFSPSPRYNARDSAILLAGMHGAKVLLGTATPSVETYYNAQTGKFGFAQLTKRYSDISLPKIEVVDTLLARKRKKIKSLFSDKLLDAIGRVLAEGNQVILFQNRRGYSPFVECDECAWVPQCEHCAVSLTLHKQSNQLVCHYCGYAIQNLTSCLACGSHRLSTKGFGTEKVEDELAIFFPAARIARMDMDTTRSRNSYERIITSFEQGNVDILVGTQMVTKGLDFDRVKLVGILNADNMLNFPDFRAFERSFQLMAQVSGRAGRKGEPGEVIIQTANPNHPVIKQVVSNDFDGHFKSQLAERKQYNYPPYYRLIKLSLKHRNASVLDVASVQLGRNLRAVFKSRVLGPEEPIVSRVQNYYIKDILIKLERNVNLPKAKEIIADQVRVLMEYSPYRGLMVLPDVDPM